MRSPLACWAKIAGAVLLVCAPVHLNAQYVRDSRAGLDLSERESRPKEIVPIDYGDSYWKEGALITALPFMYYWARYFHDDGHGLVGSVLGGVFFGSIAGLPGALIGKQFPKGSDKPREDTRPDSLQEQRR